jgi:hypothetical protein
VTTWLIRIVEGRYRCWDDFLSYGMVSAGHDDRPGAPLKLLSVGDEVYAFLSSRGYVGRGEVTTAATLADDFVVDGDFVSMDGSMRCSRVKLTDIVLLRRRDICQDGDDPQAGEWVVGIKWLSTCSRKRPKRFAGMQEPNDTVQKLSDRKTKEFLASAFRAG